MAVHPIRAQRGETAARPPAPAEGGGAVLPFRARARNRFSLRDRIDLLAWAEGARRLGLSRITLERPGADEEDAQAVGDFALMYDGQSEWARWAVAREGASYLVWSPNSGDSAGSFPSLEAALAAVAASAG